MIPMKYPQLGINPPCSEPMTARSPRSQAETPEAGCRVSGQSGFTDMILPNGSVEIHLRQKYVFAFCKNDWKCISYNLSMFNEMDPPLEH